MSTHSQITRKVLGVKHPNFHTASSIGPWTSHKSFTPQNIDGLGTNFTTKPLEYQTMHHKENHNLNASQINVNRLNQCNITSKVFSNYSTVNNQCQCTVYWIRLSFISYTSNIVTVPTINWKLSAHTTELSLNFILHFYKDTNFSYNKRILITTKVDSVLSQYD
jgi:hypothetical protein